MGEGMTFQKVNNYWLVFSSVQTSVKLTVPKTAIVSGYCDDKKSYLVLRYTEGGASRGVAFYLSHVGTGTKLENIETILKLDSAKFPSAKHTNGMIWKKNL